MILMVLNDFKTSIWTTACSGKVPDHGSTPCPVQPEGFVTDVRTINVELHNLIHFYVVFAVKPTAISKTAITTCTKNLEFH